MIILVEIRPEHLREIIGLCCRWRTSGEQADMGGQADVGLAIRLSGSHPLDVTGLEL